MALLYIIKALIAIYLTYNATNFVNIVSIIYLRNEHREEKVTREKLN